MTAFKWNRERIKMSWHWEEEHHRKLQEVGGKARKTWANLQRKEPQDLNKIKNWGSKCNTFVSYITGAVSKQARQYCSGLGLWVILIKKNLNNLETSTKSVKHFWRSEEVSVLLVIINSTSSSYRSLGQKYRTLSQGNKSSHSERTGNAIV